MWLKEMKQPAPTCRPPIAAVVVAVVLSKMSTTFVKALPVQPPANTAKVPTAAAARERCGGGKDRHRGAGDTSGARTFREMDC